MSLAVPIDDNDGLLDAVAEFAASVGEDLDDDADDGRSVLGGILAGALGGIAGVWIMAQVDDILEMTIDETDLGRRASGASPRRPDDPLGVAPARRDTASTRAAHSLARAAGHPLEDAQAAKAAPYVAYGFGALAGGLYGALAELMPWTAAGRGTLFGAWLWAGVDLVAVPRLGLAERHPGGDLRARIVDGLRGLSRRSAWGFTADTVRRMLRALF